MKSATQAKAADLQTLEKRSRQKYCFAPAMDEEIRRAYHLYIEYNNRKAIGACARNLGYPKWVITRRAGFLGVARIKEPEWSKAEVHVVEKWQHLTDAAIQRKLKAKGLQRSVNAVRRKVQRLRIKQNRDGYSAQSLADAFGVNCHKVIYWINHKMLSASRRGTARSASQGGDTYWITHADVREFCADPPRRSGFAEGREVVVSGPGDQRTHRGPMRSTATSEGTSPTRCVRLRRTRVNTSKA